MSLLAAPGPEESRTKASQAIVGTGLAFLGVVLVSTISDAGWGGLAAALGVTLVGLGLLLHVVVRSIAPRPGPDAAPRPSARDPLPAPSPRPMPPFVPTRTPSAVLAAVLALALTSCGLVAPPVAAQSPAADPAASAEALLDAIRARHAGSWYRTLTFVQATTFHTPQGPQTQTWFEAAQIPGRLRIDVAPREAGTTYLVVGDSTHIAQGGRVVQRQPRGNPLLLLGFDLPFLSTAEGIAGMQAIGIDTDAVRADTWQGRPAIVVGGAPGDTTSAQAWFDRERLVFVRLIEVEDGTVQDIRFDDYRPLAGGWIAPRVEVYAGGRLVMEEDYRAVQANVDLPAGTFDPRSWPTTNWWPAAGYDGTE